MKVEGERPFELGEHGPAAYLLIVQFVLQAKNQGAADDGREDAVGHVGGENRVGVPDLGAVGQQDRGDTPGSRGGRNTALLSGA